MRRCGAVEQLTRPLFMSALLPPDDPAPPPLGPKLRLVLRRDDIEVAVEVDHPLADDVAVRAAQRLPPLCSHHERRRAVGQRAGT